MSTDPLPPLDRASFRDWLFGGLYRRLDALVAELAGLHAAADQLQTDINEAIDALNNLAAKVAAGDASQADIDAITAQLANASEALDTAVATDNPPDPPADPPTESEAPA